MRIPSVEITKIDMDFEKGIVIAKEIEMKIKVNGCKKYDTDRGWVVVVYVDLVNEGDKAELVWPEFGKPFFQQIDSQNTLLTTNSLTLDVKSCATKLKNSSVHPSDSVRSWYRLHV